MRRILGGLDELAIETAFIGVSALVFIVVAAWALRTPAAQRLDSVPVLGAVVGAARTLVGQVAN